MVEPWSIRTLIVGAAAAVGVPLALTVLTPLAGDVAMIGVAAAGAGVGGWAIRIRRWLDALPLEIAPVVAAGRVDGTPVYRFRARLGRGRRLREASATVRAEDEHGAVVELPTWVAGGVLTGPFTILAQVPPGHPGGLRRFEIEVAGTAGGRRWASAATLDASAVRPGRFGGIDASGGRVRIDDWTAIVPPPGG